MPLSASTRIGPYEIVAAIGAGGMGEVYRARDPRLGRDVAIKVLPELLSADPERLRRFEHEARAAAALNHPNILAVHDVGTHDGAPYLVAELLEGETLRERLSAGALPVRKAVDYALQIAQGLAAAHDRGIVHRDLKPENVFVTTDDRVKILDFGLARAVGPLPADAGTVGLSQATEIGTVLGTVGYMAPEQVRGQAADHRADVFAFGCVLYEMLTGRRAFSGATPADTFTAVLNSEPALVDPATVTIPIALVRIVSRCLEKTAALRFQSARDLAFAIENVTSTSAGLTGDQRVVAVRDRRMTPAIAAIAAIMAVGAMVVAAVMLASRSAPEAVLSFGRTIALTHEEGLELHPALSPDGSLVAYAGGSGAEAHIYVRQVAGGRAIDLTPSAHGSYPRWSADGTRILFVSRTGAYVVPALGGTSRRIIDRARAAEWSPDGKEIAYVGDEDRVYARSLDGGQPRIVVEAREPHSLAWSPDGRFLAFTSGNQLFMGPGRQVGNLAPSRVMIVPAAGGTGIPVTDANAVSVSPTWTPDSRRLLFVSNAHGTRDVFEVDVTAEGRPGSNPRRLTAGLNAHTVVLSRDGRRLAYATFTLSSNIWSIPIPEKPPISIREAVPITSGRQIVEGLSVSRDGRWLAFDSNVAGNQDIYRLRLPDGDAEQVTTDPADEFEPTWSPDSTMIAFHAWPSGNRDVYAIGADGRGRQRLTSDPGHEWVPSWSPDGSRIVFADTNRGGVSTIVRNTNGWSTPAFHTSGSFFATFSPDGRTLLLTGNLGANAGEMQTVPTEGGATRVLLRGPVPGSGAIPSFGRWAADGRRVFFFGIDPQGRSSIWSMSPAGGTPTLVVRFDDPARESNRREFDVDSQRLYFTLARKEGDVWVMDVEAGAQK